MDILPRTVGQIARLVWNVISKKGRGKAITRYRFSSMT